MLPACNCSMRCLFLGSLVSFCLKIFRASSNATWAGEMPLSKATISTFPPNQADYIPGITVVVKVPSTKLLLLWGDGSRNDQCPGPSGYYARHGDNDSSMKVERYGAPWTIDEDLADITSSMVAAWYDAFSPSTCVHFEEAGGCASSQPC